MRLDDLYLVAKNIKKVNNFYRPGIEITYYLEPVEHEQLQQECFKKINNTFGLDKYTSRKSFELFLLDIRFIFKIK